MIRNYILYNIEYREGNGIFRSTQILTTGRTQAIKEFYTQYKGTEITNIREVPLDNDLYNQKLKELTLH